MVTYEVTIYHLDGTQTHDTVAAGSAIEALAQVAARQPGRPRSGGTASPINPESDVWAALRPNAVFLEGYQGGPLLELAHRLLADD